MVRTTQNITASALALPEPERLALATRLLDSLHGRNEPDPDAAWLREAVRRLREVSQGKVETLSTDDVLDAARAAIRAKGCSHGWRVPLDRIHVSCDFLNAMPGPHAPSPAPSNKARGEPQVLASHLDPVLRSLGRARAEDRVSKQHPIWAHFGAWAAAVRESQPVKSRPDLSVKWSLGQGAWALVPWLAVLDPTATTRVSDGLYVIYLLRADLSGVYATLNQGVTGTPMGVLRERAKRLRKACTPLQGAGFQLDSEMNLHAGRRTDLADAYESAVIAYKLYPADALPSDSRFTEDLEVLLKAYAASWKLLRTDRTIWP